MQLCDDHFKKLKEKIKFLGMEHLIATDEDEIADRVGKELSGQEMEVFDPVIACQGMIFQQALHYGGPSLLHPKPDGSEVCPICEALNHKRPELSVSEAEEMWIGGSAMVALEKARERGLVAGQQ